MTDASADELAALDLFAGCSTESLVPLAAQLSALTAAPGQVLMRPGERAVSAGWFERYQRSFAGTIAGGTSEIQRTIIAQRVLGPPRR